MSAYDKRRIVRLYGSGKNYVLASQAIENQKLLIKVDDSAVCVNTITNDEWSSMQSKTNSVRSAAYSLVLDAYGCLGLLSTSQISNGKTQDAANMLHYLVFVNNAMSVGTIRKFDILRITDVYLIPLNGDVNSNVYTQQANNSNVNSNFVNELRKFLSSGFFYFVYTADSNSTFDLTLSCQNRQQMHQTNKKFLWNYNLTIPFRRFNVDVNQWLLKIICGCVEVKKVFILRKTFKACLISRLSCERVGTRFNCRGVNDDGNCANFVETEQILYSEDTDEESSYLQIRGSVPVFFEQTGLQVGSHRIKISRGLEACYPAFERHIKSITKDYGSYLMILNLLGVKGDESFLTECFHRLCRESPFSMRNELIYANFDYHTETKNNKQALVDKLWKIVSEQFYYDNHKQRNTDGMFFYTCTTNDSTKLQTKFIRTNCMDCLDRTNKVQAFLAMEFLQFQLGSFSDEIDGNKLREVRELFHQMWVSNGDCISKIYAGTGAIQGRSVTQDITRSFSRTIQNNFMDNTKQDAMETFLFSMSRNYGDLADRVRILISQNALRLPYPVLCQLVAKKNEYNEKVKCRVSIHTWNINGGLSFTDMEQLDLNEWLLNGLDERENHVDIFAVGFEEIVDLNAQNIVNASDENASKWYSKLFKFLEKHKKLGEYVPLIIDPLQLVGVCLFIFVLKKHVGAIREVCVARTKTGLGGTAGNKGGVMIRFVYYNTSLCFVCSHFAAHQKEVDKRNEDFRQIYENSEFSGQSVSGASKIDAKSHDYVFWFGDLNYRIDMSNDRCRSLIAERDWASLLECDQLSIQRREQNVFREFIEAPVSFPPTYKYNLYEDSYDRSEKCRVPAWTDRILWRRRVVTKQDRENKYFDFGKCLFYGRADVRLSDHRPVSALLEIETDRVVPKKLIEALNRTLMELHGPFQVVLIVSTHNYQLDEMIKADIVDLFKQFKSFGMFREYKNNLYITYSNGKCAYDAYAELNNFYLDKYQAHIQVKVENEHNFQKLIEQEVFDCMMSLNSIKDNSRTSLQIPDDRNIQVADLIGASEVNEDSALIRVPSQIHSSISITHNMQIINSQEGEYISSERHLYHNPTLRTYSNSNIIGLSGSDEASNKLYHHSNNIHSASSLIGMSNEMGNSNNQLNLILPPKRPPPPPPPNDLKFNISQANPVKIQSPLIQIDTAESFKFDDDFGSIPFQSGEEMNTSNMAPTRPPPLPPFPPTSQAFKQNADKSNQQQQQETPKNPMFSLFDDLIETSNPFDQQTFGIDSQKPAPSSRPPPPLPPLPPMPPNLNPFYNMANNNTVSNGIRPAPVPPPLPPMPSTIPIIPERNSFPLQSIPPQVPNRLSENSINEPKKDLDNICSNPFFQVKQLKDYDILSDSVEIKKNVPLPPPRPNHFK